MFAQSYLKYFLTGHVQHLILHVTNRCNFRCKHCFVDFDNPTDLHLDICKNLGKEVGNLFWLDIAGGEPFLHKNLVEIIESFKAQVIMIPSNGFLTDVIVDQLKAIKKKTRASVGVSFSIEGLKETNDKIRKIGSWDAVWRTYEKVKQINGISVKINTVLTRDNQDEIIECMREVKKYNPDFHSIILLRGLPNDPDTELPDLDNLRRLIPEIIAVQGGYSYGQNPLSSYILKNYHKYMWELSYRILQENRQVIPCLGGQAHMVIYADGAVAPCELLPRVDNLSTQSWNDILHSDYLINQKKDIKRGMCWCTHNCALIDSIFFSPRSLPKLLLP